ncbi:unnamed protein product [Hermetia illucens]|uniref:Uncharacterized protein n=1 Tax=Hermetia illucens TaxID=343691 RepID=A0A7R8UG00_HERIL|nr:golgin subfamily A member 2-like [Hermetia illucens]CAD7079327.1 unnamed protein product [Hermetia illucens]
MMDFDPFHISTLKSQIASTESALASLQAEIKQKEEEKQRMESQIIKLSENIASKDQTIYDLQTKIQILEQSVMQLTNGAREKEDARKMADFYRDELEKREKEVVLLTRERDMLNWKLIYEASSENEVQEERNQLREKNEKLTKENSGLTSELEHLTRKIDIMARQNLELSNELEKRSKRSDKLKADFEEAIRSRDRVRSEMENIKKKLIEVQNSLKNNIAVPSIKRMSRAKSIEKPPPSVSHKPTTTLSPMKLARSALNNKMKESSRTSRPPLSRMESSVAPLAQDIEKNTVRKLVRNIQSSFLCSPVPGTNTKPYMLVQPEQPDEESSFDFLSSDDVSSARKTAVENIREILESKLLNDSKEKVLSDTSSEKEFFTTIKEY